MTDRLILMQYMNMNGYNAYKVFTSAVTTGNICSETEAYHVIGKNFTNAAAGDYVSLTTNSNRFCSSAGANSAVKVFGTTEIMIYDPTGGGGGEDCGVYIFER